jgi:hypothetical protein
MARAVALPMATASTRSFVILASGVKGLPLTMPMEATSPRVSGSSESIGSFWITRFRSSKKPKSLGEMVL